MADDDLTQSPRDFAFLVAPISLARSEIRARSDTVLALVRHVLDIFQLSLVRADQIVGTGIITSDIITSLARARFIIADISGSNPNVMYEVGIAHTLGRQVILITDESTDIPFDIAITRVIRYDLETVKGAEDFQKRLTQTIQLLMSGTEPGLTGVSPVQIALGADHAQAQTLQSAEDIGTSPSERILATLGDMRERMASMEARMVSLAGRQTSASSDEAGPTYSRKIFIVHGHDTELKLELRNFLRDLDFEPIILHERPDGGKTIYSKLLGEASDVGYAFILLSPDDRGGKADTDEFMPRARQNVVFEHGLFTGHLSPERVCAIVRKSVEIPSDLHGVVYKQVADGASLTSIALDLARELRAAGYDIDMNKLS
jgi:predicted nucleotide-binding protein